MNAATWAKRVSMAVVGSTVLTLGTVNISQAQTTQGFEPPAPGTFVPNTGGLIFTGLTSASSGGNGVALSTRTASVTGNPVNTPFQFFGVDLGRTSTSSGNLAIRVQAFFLDTATGVNTQLYSQNVTLSATGLTSFVAPTGQTQVTSVRFTSFIPAAPVASPDTVSGFSLSSDSVDEISYVGDGYGSEYEGEYGSGYAGGYDDEDCGRLSFYVDNLSYSAVPEPTSILGLMVASGGIAALKRKYGKKSAQKDKAVA